MSSSISDRVVRVNRQIPGLAQALFDYIGVGAVRRNCIIKPHVVAKAAQDCRDLLRLFGGRAGVGDEDV